jgi:hypothetical protein
MKTTLSLCFVLVLTILACLYMARPGEKEAYGQAAATTGNRRFDIATYAAAVPGSRADYGCYIIDTFTGETWVSHQGNQPTKVSDKLLR